MDRVEEEMGQEQEGCTQGNQRLDRTLIVGPAETNDEGSAVSVSK
jgi:hypothetical protein